MKLSEYQRSRSFFDLVKGHSDFKVKLFDFGLVTQVSDSGPHGPLVWVTLYQNCLNGFDPLNKMATRTKNGKIFKQHLLVGQWPHFKIFSQKCSLGDPLPKLLKLFHSAEQNGRQS